MCPVNPFAIAAYAKTGNQCIQMTVVKLKHVLYGFTKMSVDATAFSSGLFCRIYIVHIDFNQFQCETGLNSSKFRSFAGMKHLTSPTLTKHSKAKCRAMQQLLLKQIMAVESEASRDASWFHCFDIFRCQDLKMGMLSDWEDKVPLRCYALRNTCHVTLQNLFDYISFYALSSHISVSWYIYKYIVYHVAWLCLKIRIDGLWSISSNFHHFPW